MEAILAERLGSEEQMVDSVGAGVRVFVAAMATLDRGCVRGVGGPLELAAG
jgi:hypothetical protein